jgi:hypothetical protein
MAGLATVDPGSPLGGQAPGLPAVDLPEAPPPAARGPRHGRAASAAGGGQ